ncbi:MAG: YitT family protein [Oscillospiraceae bacterium]|nr:YitT family protein [Oscillospiraceae bacterium]
MKQWLTKLAYITLAIALMSASVNMFLAPHNIAAGGITGLSIILESLFTFDRGLVILISNIIILLVTLISLERQVFFNTVIGALLLPLFIMLIPHITLVSDTMLSMIVGSVIFGIAVSILYYNKASSGGTSIPPLVLKKYFNLNTSIGLFITDGIVVLLCLLVFSIDAFFFAMLSIFITSATMSYIESGLNKKKMVHIISDKSAEISDDIMTNLEKGVTIVPVIGAYKQKDMHMLIVTLDFRKYQQLLAIVNNHDKDAFMITDTVTDVHGKGFSYDSGTV